MDEEEKKALEEELDSLIEKVSEKINASNKKEISELKEQIEVIEDNLAKKEIERKSRIVKVAGREFDMFGLKAEQKLGIVMFALAKGEVEKVKTVLNTGTDAQGGYTLPKPYFRALVNSAKDFMRIRPLVTELPMSSKTLDITTIVDADKKPTVVDTEESAKKTETSATFGKVILTAFKQASVLPLTDELIADSNFDLINILVGILGKNIGRRMDNLILNGNDTTQPEGLFVNPVINDAAIKTKGVLTFDHIIDAEYSVTAEKRPGSVFLANTVQIKDLRKIKDKNGQYLWSNGTTAGQPSTLDGYHVLESSYVPAGQIMFGNLENYWFGLRQDATVRVSSEARFEEDQTVIRAVTRYGGKVGDTDSFKKIIVTAA